MLESAGLVVARKEGRYRFHFIDTRPLQTILDRWSIGADRKEAMRISVTSVFVDDQDKALKFYTEVLGFAKKTEIPLGEARWLTVVSPDEAPAEMGSVTTAVFDDTSGNLIQIAGRK